MRLLLLGGTGRTGGHLLRLALEQGHQLTVLARALGRLTVTDDRVHPVVGDATDTDAIARAIRSRPEAVVCALGPRSATNLVRCRLMQSSMAPLIQAMERSAVGRLVVLSALGVGESAHYAPAAQRLMFKTLLRAVGTDKADAERGLRASQLTWTIVYAPPLTNRPATGRYQHGEALAVNGLPRISRADVAEFMLVQLTDPTYHRRSAIVVPTTRHSSDRPSAAN